MAYYLVRLYTGSGPAEELMQTVIPELAGRLKAAGGLQRYATGVTDDGRLVSASVYESKEAAERGLQAAAEFVSRSDALKGYQLQQAFGGEIVREEQGPAAGERGNYGFARVTTTSMTAEQVADTLIAGRSEKMKNVPGRVRTLFVQLDDGRVVGVSAFTSSAARDEWVTLIRQVDQTQENAQRVFAGGFEDINATVHFQQA